MNRQGFFPLLCITFYFSHSQLQPPQKHVYCWSNETTASAAGFLPAIFRIKATILCCAPLVQHRGVALAITYGKRQAG